MKPSIWHRMDTLSCQLTPFLLTLALVILTLIPFHIPGMARIMPLLSLVAIYHWGVYRSDLLPAYAVFLIGLVQDALSGVPMGVYTVIYVVAYSVVAAQHRFFSGKSFYIVWLGFAVISGAASAAAWTLISMVHGSLVDPGAVLYQYALGLGCYPVIAHVFVRWQRAILRQI